MHAGTLCCTWPCTGHVQPYSAFLLISSKFLKPSFWQRLHLLKAAILPREEKNTDFSLVVIILSALQ